MKTESFSITTSGINVTDKQVILEGQLIIKNAASIKKGLLSAFDSSQNVTLVFKNVIKVDLSVLQLLVALQNSAAIHNKKLSIDSELTDSVKSVLLNSGLQKIFIPEFKSNLNGVP